MRFRSRAMRRSSLSMASSRTLMASLPAVTSFFVPRCGPRKVAFRSVAVRRCSARAQSWRVTALMSLPKMAREGERGWVAVGDDGR